MSARVGPLEGRQAVVWGLGVFGGGLAVVRYLASQGAKVRVLDQKDATALQASVAELSDLDVELVLGRDHQEADFQGADVVVKSPAIPPTVKWVKWLADAGVPVTSEIELGLSAVTEPYALVTGSKGKSTTTGLLGAMLAGTWSTETAGNNEKPLLDLVMRAERPERIVIEASSFMADALSLARAQGAQLPRPEVLAFTSLVPEHLNWHGSVEAYYEAKLSLLELEPRVVVIPAADAELCARVPGRASGDLIYTGPGASERPGPAVYMSQEGVAVERRDGVQSALFEAGTLKLLGGHNMQNALVAAACARALGATGESVASGVAAFDALPHRLETVAVSPRGVRFVNDSMATTPASALAALRAVPGPVVLLAGGSDKGAAYAELGRVAAQVTHTVVCLGEIRDQIASAVEAAGGPAAVVRVGGSFDEAFAEAVARCPEGGAVLLAPATASYDMFPNFKARGERFRELARAVGR